MEQVDVYRGKFGDPVAPTGPYPGVRSGEVLAYDLTLPEQFEPWPGHTRVERIFVLLDLGISLSLPNWRTMRSENGTLIYGIDPESPARTTWYVDLIAVDDTGPTVYCRDLWIDVMVPVDGRHYRLLDLDEFADAMESGALPGPIALDGLRRWQRFLDTHLHQERDPRGGWTDFPPASLASLTSLPSPL